jgi:ABC-type transporter Mla MlaB component
MAKDDTTTGGIFGKMVRFVRNPATEWSSIDQKDSDREESYSKQALKEMIERKRRNDFVRKREFDMLRKLRRREISGAGPSGDGSVRPSFFQSSMPSRPDDRAMTLKKIDEIEAQMSMQWWKTKHGVTGNSPMTGTSPGSSGFPNSDVGGDARSSMPAAEGANNQRAYARTAPDHLNDAIKRSMERLQQQQAQREAGVDFSSPKTNPATPTAASAAAAPVARAPAVSPITAPVTTPAGAAATPFTNAHLGSPDSPLAFDPTMPAGLPNLAAPPLKPAAAAAPAANPATAPVTAKTVPTPTPAAAPRLVPPAVAPASAQAQKPNAPVIGHMAAYDNSNTTGFSASKLFAVDVGEVQHDPELEEAAIRFANGDDEGAEAGLKEAIAPHGPRHNHEDTWLTLFDLYRATGNHDRFDALGIDFAGKFSRSAPMWFSIPEMVGQLTSRAAPLVNTNPVSARKSDWRAPATIGIQTLAALNAAIAKAPMPWTLDWGNLQNIEPNALVPLTKLLKSWALQPVQLRYMGTQRLDELLAKATPSGSRDVNQEWWMLRLAHLRVSHRPDEFELAALDFCVTYEVSPPAWESARCEFKLIDADGNTGMGQTIIGEAIRDSIMSEMGGESAMGSSLMTTQVAAVELSGQIQGDPIGTLEKLETRLEGADVMIISCAKLIRVDFSAAGTVLNWVSAKQSEGRLVQFTEVNRMVAAFFHVIGISEHAKVQTRAN